MNGRAMAAVALLGILPGDGAAAQSADAFTPVVAVVRARGACFSFTIPVTGFVVARREAVVILLPGDVVTDVLAREGDRVTADQTVAQVTRASLEPPRPGVEPKAGTASLRAPAAGTVIRSTASVGATGRAAQAEPLFRIAVDGEVELEAEVPSIQAPELSAGQGARVLFGDFELNGRVRLTPAAIDPRTQLGRARISLGVNSQLRFATLARASINARQSCGLSVPRAAVIYRTGGTSVQVVNGDVIETRTVQIGLHSDTEVEIASGLAEGDRVVANAGTSLRDGDKVKPTDAPPAPSGER